MGTRFSARPDRPWGPPSLLYNGYLAFPGGKVRSGRAADHSPPSSAVVIEEQSYISTRPLGHTGPVTGKLYLFVITYYSRRPLSACRLRDLVENSGRHRIQRCYEEYLTFLGAFGKSRKAPITFAVSVRPSACVSAAPTGRTSVILYEYNV